eukprot:TRINITY_DN612_c0_g1_i8.p2 TRINITY_DN612_c0_g1~~TRINITY_DN612_c0_g1_i8.p2  ORF type:complete len:100 (-),score=16.68 TRINITY_DN612_c0_g1_i8:1289-1588(-)
MFLEAVVSTQSTGAPICTMLALSTRRCHLFKFKQVSYTNGVRATNVSSDVPILFGNKVFHPTPSQVGSLLTQRWTDPTLSRQVFEQGSKCKYHSSFDKG